MNVSARRGRLLWIVLPAVVLLPFLVRGVPIFSRSSLGSDYLTKQLPNAVHFHDTWLKESRLPLWQPAFMSGAPVAGNPSYLLTYPPYWLVLFLPPAAALNWLFAFHLVFAGIGGWLFARRGLGLRHSAAVVTGLAYAMAPKMLAHVSGGQLDVLIAVAWFPYTLLATWQAFGSGSWQWSWLGGAALGVMVVAHSPTALLFTPMLIAAGAWRIWNSRERPSTPIPPRSWTWIAGTCALAAVAAGVGFLTTASAHLVPFLELFPFLQRTGLSLVDAAAYALPPAVLPVMLAFPTVPFPEWIIYPGAIPATLAAFGVWRGRLPGKGLWLGAATVAGLYAMGEAAPVFGLAHAWLPGFDLMRVPSRAWFLVAFIVAVFAAAGYERWQESPKAIVRFGMVILALIAASSLALSPSRDAWQWAALASAGLAGAIFLFHSSRRNPIRDSSLLLSLLLALELGAAGWAFWRVGTLPAVPEWADRVGRELAGTPLRAYTEGRLLPFQAVQLGIPLAEGLDPVQLAGYSDFVAAAGGCETDFYSISTPPFLAEPKAAADCPSRKMDSRILGLVSTAIAVTEGAQGGGWKLAEVGIGVSEFHNRDALPFARVSGTIHVADTPPSIEEILAHPEAVWVESGPRIPLGDPQAEPGSAVAQWEGPDQVHIRLAADTVGFLTVAIPYLPGWKAIDGEGNPRRVYRAQGVLLGVYVEASTSEIDFAYRPRPLEHGLRLAVLAAALSVVAFAPRLRIRRRGAGG